VTRLLGVLVLAVAVVALLLGLGVIPSTASLLGVSAADVGHTVHGLVDWAFPGR
jgi:hypothetical protein